MVGDSGGTVWAARQLYPVALATGYRRGTAKVKRNIVGGQERYCQRSGKVLHEDRRGIAIGQERYCRRSVEVLTEVRGCTEGGQ